MYVKLTGKQTLGKCQGYSKKIPDYGKLGTYIFTVIQGVKIYIYLFDHTYTYVHIIAVLHMHTHVNGVEIDSFNVQIRTCTYIIPRQNCVCKYTCTYIFNH